MKQITVFQLIQTSSKKSNPTWTAVSDCGIYIMIMILSYIKCNCDSYWEMGKRYFSFPFMKMTTVQIAAQKHYRVGQFSRLICLWRIWVMDNGHYPL